MYLNVIQLAESFGVEESVVTDWIRNESLPVIEDRGRLLFDRAQVVNWAASRGMAARVGFLAPTPSKSPAGLGLDSLLQAGGIFRNVLAEAVPGLFADILAQLPGATEPIRQMLRQRLESPGGISWAAVGGGFALPHLRAPVALGRDAGALAIVLLREPLAVSEPTPDGQPLTRLLFFVAPSPRAHLELLARLSAALSRGDLRQRLVENAPDAGIRAALAAANANAKGGTP